MPTVHLTSTAIPGDRLDDEALGLVDSSRAILAEQPDRFEYVADPAAAEFIVFIEPPRFKFASYAEVLLASEPLQRFPDRCFAYDWADGAAGFLPGVYPEMRRSQWDPTRLVPGGYLHPYNAELTAVARAGLPQAGSPRWLLSFRGHLSHDLRRRISETPTVIGDPDVEFVVTDEWYTHTADQQRSYVDNLLDCRFVLCPRGVSPGSYRIYEAMALGRVPVIVSDEWTAPPGPDWGAFSLRVSEDRITDLPRIVRERADDWAEMGRQARKAWEDFFDVPNLLRHTLRSIEQMALARPRAESLDELQALWASRRFKLDHGWAASQRLERLLSSAEARERLRARILG